MYTDKFTGVGVVVYSTSGTCKHPSTFISHTL